MRCASGRELVGDAVVLAVGHSARAVYELLHRARRRARGQAVRRRRARRASAAAHRSHPVRARLRPSAAAGGLLPPDGDGADARRGRSRRLQLLHVPGRLDRRLVDGAGRAVRQRHEPQAARLAVRQRRARGHRRAARLPRPLRRRAAGRRRAAARHRARAPSSSAAAASWRRRSAWPTSWRAAPTTTPLPSSYRPRVVGGDVRGALPPFVGDALERALGRFRPHDARLRRRRGAARRRRDAHQLAGAHRARRRRWRRRRTPGSIPPAKARATRAASSPRPSTACASPTRSSPRSGDAPLASSARRPALERVGQRRRLRARSGCRT